jgi:hypothetical protein
MTMKFELHNDVDLAHEIFLRETCFTPCTRLIWLLEPMTDAAEIAAQRAPISLSPARSSFDRFQNARKCREKLYTAAKSISWGGLFANPNITGQLADGLNLNMSLKRNQKFSSRGFLREKHGANHPLIESSLQKGRQ